jgi:competence protein ComEC
MQSWNPYPFFRLLIPFALGIIAAIKLNESFGLNRLELLAITAGLALPAVLSYFIKSFRFRLLPGFLILLFMMVAGYNLTMIRSAHLDPYHLLNNPKQDGFLLARVVEPVSEKARSVKVIASAEAFADTLEQSKVTGKILLYLEKDSAALALNYGDYLFLKNRLAPTQPPGNPHQFNYKKFLSNSGIHHQMYLRAEEWKKTERTRKNPVFAFAFSARETMLRLLEKNGLKGDEFAVVSAILLGYNENMDQELREKYAGAGALHVLCVSGLHVGIIFFILSFLLKPLDKRKNLRYLKMVLLLLFIWCFAFITGLSPSVMRASLMFSLFSWRESRKDKSNPYNIIAASALILMVVDPYIITKIGFQLSYSAVIAIIALFDPIYKLLAFRNTVADYFWKLAVVSIAAQLGTFPLAVHYFNQFPVYFLLTNIIVIPLVWLILNLGVAVFTASVFSSFVSAKLSIILHYLLVGLNGSVDFIHSIPGATADGLVLNAMQVILFYTLIVLMSRAFILRNGNLMAVALVIMTLISSTFMMRQFEIQHQKFMVVYKINGQTAIDFVKGKEVLMLADSAVLHDKRLMDFNITGNRVQSGIRQAGVANLDENAIRSPMDNLHKITANGIDFINFGNKRLSIIEKDFESRNVQHPLAVDYLMIRNNPRINIQDLHSQFSFDKLILDGSNSFSNIRRWKSDCDSLGIQYHDVKNEGYFMAAF